MVINKPMDQSWLSHLKPQGINRNLPYNKLSHYDQILEALTTLNCCENFSMQRLELLGDSVLKYAVSCHLLLRNPEKHEGQLSHRRSSLASNSALHKLGTDRKLQVLDLINLHLRKGMFQTCAICFFIHIMLLFAFIFISNIAYLLH